MKLIFTSILFILISCGKGDDNTDVYGYPEGITINDTISINDCSLSECSDERIVRLIARDVIGKITRDTISGRFGMTYTYTFDSVIHFSFCNLPEEFQKDNIKVIFDGKLLDACGVMEAVWPVEESYVLKLDKIAEL